jgi:putative transcriptional regulator
MHEGLAEKIAGEITLSMHPGETLRKWRTIFDIPQNELAQHLGISSSVISDYESGRRKSPGVGTVRKIVLGLIDLDMARGSKIVSKYSVMSYTDVVLDIKEFPRGIRTSEFLANIDGELLSHDIEKLRDREHEYINGYTVIDSLKAIMRLTSSDYLKVYGWSTQRALLFTGVEFGRSPMIAIRAHPLKPALVVYIKPERVDVLAIALARLENVLLAATYLELEEIMDRLGKTYKEYLMK